MNQAEVLESIPHYLRQFCVQQHYELYTPQDQAVWRYIMHRNMHALRLVAHPAYVEGLAKTGINTERIPDINEMNERLAKIGWRAVVVDGFVPPAAFMEFQEHRILVISADIRNIANVLYTPAPDIVHEAAGHAPIIAEERYAEFLQRVGEYGAKAVFSKLDYELYEAIRYLSIIKEYPDATDDEIRQAEKEMEDAIARNTNPSEASLLSRFHWWTVEYGLMGTPEDFSLYGAGLLSSVGESKACLDPKVKKLPLTVECVNYNYDITEMQPQLFVARDFDHLHEVLEEFASSMCFRVGGASSVRKLISTENVGTCVLSSGLQISGVFNRMETDADGKVALLETSGPTQLAFADQELCCHGTAYHNEGYMTLVGSLKEASKPLEDYDEGDLFVAGVQVGQPVHLEYSSGYRVKGTLKNILRREGRIILLTVAEAEITDAKGWKVQTSTEEPISLAVGEAVTSVYSGTADRIKFNVYPAPSKRATIKVTHTPAQKALFSLYETVFRHRQHGSATTAVLVEIHRQLETYPNEWLIRLELLELCMDHHIEPLAGELRQELLHIAGTDAELDDLIRSGLEMLGHTNEMAF